MEYLYSSIYSIILLHAECRIIVSNYDQHDNHLYDNDHYDDRNNSVEALQMFRNASYAYKIMRDQVTCYKVQGIS